MLLSPPVCLRASLMSSRLPPSRATVQLNSIATLTQLKQLSRTFSSRSSTALHTSDTNSSPLPKTFIRSASNKPTSAPTNPNAPISPPFPATPHSSSTTHSPPILTWDRYLHLRLIRRRYALASSVLTSLITGSTGAVVLADQDLDAMGINAFGLDPMVLMGMATIVCAGTGWLVGPFAGEAVWGLRYRQYKGGMAAKEKEFYQRIKKYRPDPSGVGVSNPLPDYYGEKISSVKGYRSWLKDQRAFRKKREG